jgi:tungstate transport system substrate-binding protein
MNGKPCSAYLFLALAVVALLILLPLTPLGCGGDDTPLVLAATNDLEGSGILLAWTDGYQSKTGTQVELVVVPDEQALDMARHGECDLILTHIPEEEKRLERSGYLETGQEIMRDDYVLVGPPADPAGIREIDKVTDALKKIAETQQIFILRIDGSGTAYMQNLLWSISGVSEAGEWLLPTEAGADESLRQASQEGAYTLCGRSSFERLAGELYLEILLEGDEALVDPYYAAAVSTLTYPDTNLAGAQEFIDYLLSPDAQSFFSLGAWETPSE